MLTAARFKVKQDCYLSRASANGGALDNCNTVSYSSRSRFRRLKQKDLSMSTYFPSGVGLAAARKWHVVDAAGQTVGHLASEVAAILSGKRNPKRSEEHTSELQSQSNIVCRLLLEKK